MALVMERDYRLRWMDFDKYGRMQPSAILDLCQDMATLHANELGIGHDRMVERGVFWAVIHAKYEVLKEPEHHQVVTVRTWPHTLSRFSFIRDYHLLDEQGELLVKATTEWVVMDIETRKFASVKDHYAGPTDFCEDRAFEKKPRKICGFEEGNRPVCTIEPQFSDLDLNGHVNNARYANYVVNALNPTGEGFIKTLQIDYRHEVLAHAPLEMHTLVEDGHVLSKGINENGDVAFACAIDLAFSDDA